MNRKLSAGEIAKATGGILNEAAFAGTPVTGISTDTRTLQAGDVFFALAGEVYDAHDFLEMAAGKGASLLVVRRNSPAPGSYSGAVLEVEDTLAAYQSLAEYYLSLFAPLVIAVTGSVGKTTVKDMTAAILSEKIRTYSTKGNMNNQIGLPRTILESDEETEILVLEMGMAGPGEIRRLAGIAGPRIAVITNIGISHRENFDSDDGILKAKMEITAFMGEGDTLIIDAGGAGGLVQAAREGSLKSGYEVIKVGEKGAADEKSYDYIVSPVSVGIGDNSISVFSIYSRKSGVTTPFTIPLPGRYAGTNAALAYAASSCAGEILGFDLSLADAAENLTRLDRTPGRLQPILKGGILVIDDTYNASPDSAGAGLDYLKNINAKRRLVVLADMNELGDKSEEKHRETGAAAVNCGADIIFAYGFKAKQIADGAKAAVCPAQHKKEPKIFWFGEDDKAAMIENLLAELREDDAVYVKGSRSMKMEEVVSVLTGEEHG